MFFESACRVRNFSGGGLVLMNTLLSIAVYADERSNPAEETDYGHGQAYGYEAVAERAALAFANGSSLEDFADTLADLMGYHKNEHAEGFDKGATDAIRTCAQMLAC